MALETELKLVDKYDAELIIDIKSKAVAIYIYQLGIFTRCKFNKQQAQQIIDHLTKFVNS